MNIKTVSGDILKQFTGGSLQEADLRWEDLQGADLQNAVLYGAKLQGAKLRGSDLQNTDLRNADLHHADLQGSKLQGSMLQGCDLRWANLRGASLQNANLQGSHLWGVDLYLANLRGITVNWKSHTLIAEILSRAASNTLQLSLAGLVLLKSEWCWEDFIEAGHPEAQFAINELRRWIKPGDNYPDCLRMPKKRG